MDTLKLLKWILSIPMFEKEILGFDSVPLLQSIFRENFLKNPSSTPSSDDTGFSSFSPQKGFAVKLYQSSHSLFGLGDSKPQISVFRQSSPNLPLTNPQIDWQSTTSLNLLLQKFRFSIHLSICTQTSSKHYQILSKYHIPVHASPSRHSVICKEISEEYSYPEINFSVDNFDEFLNGIMICGLETIYIELIASTLSTSSSDPISSSSSSKESKEYSQHRIFSTAIHYETLLEACSRKNIVKRHGQSFGLVRALDSAGTGTRTELITKRKIKRSMSDGANLLEHPRTLLSGSTSGQDSNPDSLEFNAEAEEKQNNLALEFYLLNRLRNRVKLLSNNQRQGLTIGLEDLFGCNDIHIEETSTIDPWNQRGFEQSLSQCRKALKFNPDALNVCVTRIALPIESILQRIITT